MPQTGRRIALVCSCEKTMPDFGPAAARAMPDARVIGLVAVAPVLLALLRTRPGVAPDRPAAGASVA